MDDSAAHPGKIARGAFLKRTAAALAGLSLGLRAGRLAAQPARLGAAVAAAARELGSPAAALALHTRTGAIDACANPDWIFRRVFPPGSLAKSWAATTLLARARELGFDPAAPYVCRGRFYIDGLAPAPTDARVFNIQRDEENRPYVRCSLRDGHGALRLNEALLHSCNAYFLHSFSRAPERACQHMFADFRLNDLPGAGYDGVETISRSVDPARLSPLACTMAAIGEGGALLVTPAKAAQLYLALINDGQLLAPTESAGRTRSIGRIAAAAPVLDRVRFALMQTAAQGTLRALRAPPGVRVLEAKTGSGTPAGRRYTTHAWCFARFQAGARDRAAIVFVERGSGGVAGRAVLERTLALYAG